MTDKIPTEDASLYIIAMRIQAAAQELDALTAERDALRWALENIGDRVDAWESEGAGSAHRHMVGIERIARAALAKNGGKHE